MTSYVDNAPEGHYDTLIAAIRDAGATRVLMGGLGNAVVPRGLPDVDFTVVERNHGLTCDLPNVHVVYGNWGIVWPDGRYDAIVSDITWEDPLFAMWRKATSFAPLLAHLEPGGVVLTIVYPDNKQTLVKVRFDG